MYLYLYNLHHKSLQLIYFLSQMHQTLCSAKYSCYDVRCIFIAGCELQYKTDNDNQKSFGSLQSSQRLKEKWQK